jgi:23S rRNA pseudouridine1911/1915/1917 synthase
MGYNSFIMIQLDMTTEEKGSLTDLLMKLYPDLSKNKLNNFYRQNRVVRNDFVAQKDSDLKIGEKISILKKPQFLGDLLIYYVDKDIIVLEKPAFLLSVDSDKAPGISVHSSLKRRYGAVYPVQRLDRETTGVMVFALSREAKESLRKQFEEKLVGREYAALTHGALKEKSGTWRTFLKEGGDMKMRVAKEGVLAITHFNVIKTVRGVYSFIKCRLETGKKNQIRVHASYAGHPLVGDSRYGDAKKGGRLFLHAHKLTFTHPTRDKPMNFISPIPREFHKNLH